MGDLTTFLYARPSFLEGVGRILDLANTLSEYNVSPAPEQADAYAVSSDWRAVGEDIRGAAETFERQQPLD